MMLAVSVKLIEISALVFAILIPIVAVAVWGGRGVFITAVAYVALLVVVVKLELAANPSLARRNNEDRGLELNLGLILVFFFVGLGVASVIYLVREWVLHARRRAAASRMLAKPAEEAGGESRS